MPELTATAGLKASLLADIWLSVGSVPGASCPTRFCPDETVFKRHVMIAGGTRGGKSKLYEHLIRQLIEHGRGMAFIDPHSSSADALLDYIAYRYDDLGFARHNIHYLNPKEKLFAFDPFCYQPDEGDPLANTEYGYRAWLHSKIKAMTRIIVRGQGESEEEAQKMVRLRRWLYNGLYAVGVRDSDGRHLPLSDIFVLLNPQHPRHNNRYLHVAPYLDEKVRADFEKLRKTKDPRRQEDWVESSFNRLREMLSPLVASIFDTESHPTIDFKDIMRRNGVLLASLGTNQYFDTDESHVIAGLIILELRTAAQATASEPRNHFYLWIDEAHHFLGEDLDKMLVESAKYRVSLGLAFQDLAKLKKGELDLLPTVISQCGLRITFQQQFHEHAEILGKSLCGRNYNFEPLFHVVDRPDGHDLVVLQSETFGESTGQSTELGRSTSRSTGTSRERSHSKSNGKSHSAGVSAQRGLTDSLTTSHGTNRSHSDGTSEASSSQHGHSNTTGTSRSAGDNRALSNVGPDQRLSRGTNTSTANSSGFSDSESYGSTNGQSSSDSTGESESQSNGLSQSNQQGQNLSEAHSLSDTAGFSFGNSATSGVSESESTGNNQGRNHSVSVSPTLVARTREEWQITGKLRNSITDQTAQFASAIMSLQPQHCLVSVSSDRAFVIRVDDVSDPFERDHFSPEARQAAIDFVKQIIFSSQPYYFSPAGSTSTSSVTCATESDAAADHSDVPSDPDDPFSF